MSLNQMSLAELRQRLSQHGEEAPKGWTKAQLKLRLIEIEGEEAMLPQAKEVSPLRQMEVNINKASGAPFAMMSCQVGAIWAKRAGDGPPGSLYVKTCEKIW